MFNKKNELISNIFDGNELESSCKEAQQLLELKAGLRALKNDETCTLSTDAFLERLNAAPAAPRKLPVMQFAVPAAAAVALTVFLVNNQPGAMSNQPVANDVNVAVNTPELPTTTNVVESAPATTEVTGQPEDANPVVEAEPIVVKRPKTNRPVRRSTGQYRLAMNEKRPNDVVADAAPAAAMNATFTEPVAQEEAPALVVVTESSDANSGMSAALEVSETDGFVFGG